MVGTGPEELLEQQDTISMQRCYTPLPGGPRLQCSWMLYNPALEWQKQVEGRKLTQDEETLQSQDKLCEG